MEHVFEVDAGMTKAVELTLLVWIRAFPADPELSMVTVGTKPATNTKHPVPAVTVPSVPDTTHEFWWNGESCMVPGVMSVAVFSGPENVVRNAFCRGAIAMIPSTVEMVGDPELLSARKLLFISVMLRYWMSNPITIELENVEEDGTLTNWFFPTVDTPTRFAELLA